MRSNSTEADSGSHWKRTATSVSATPITTPIATSWTIPFAPIRAYSKGELS